MSSNPVSAVPLSLALLICDGAHRDPGSGKLYLLGLFSAIIGDSFPLTHPFLAAYLAITDANGRVPIKVRIVDAEEEREPVREFETEIHTPDPRSVAEIAIPFAGLVFEQPGEYRLQVFTCGEFLIERRIMILSREEGGK